MWPARRPPAPIETGGWRRGYPVVRFRKVIITFIHRCRVQHGRFPPLGVRNGLAIGLLFLMPSYLFAGCSGADGSAPDGRTEEAPGPTTDCSRACGPGEARDIQRLSTRTGELYVVTRNDDAPLLFRTAEPRTAVAADGGPGVRTRGAP